MKVVKLTDLVPVKALVRFNNHKSGSVFGVTPARAIAGLKSKELELFPVPDGIETYDVPGWTETAIRAVEAEPAVAVEIPEGWEKLHHLKRLKLAKEIAGDFAVPEGKKSTEVADDIIREAAAKAAPKIVPIPEGWESLDKDARILLAKAVAGDFTVNEGEDAAELADALIQDEILRRNPA